MLGGFRLSPEQTTSFSVSIHTGMKTRFLGVLLPVLGVSIAFYALRSEARYYRDVECVPVPLHPRWVLLLILALLIRLIQQLLFLSMALSIFHRSQQCGLAFRNSGPGEYLHFRMLEVFFCCQRWLVGG